MSRAERRKHRVTSPPANLDIALIRRWLKHRGWIQMDDLTDRWTTKRPGPYHLTSRALELQLLDDLTGGDLLPR